MWRTLSGSECGIPIARHAIQKLSKLELNKCLDSKNKRFDKNDEHRAACIKFLMRSFEILVIDALHSSMIFPLLHLQYIFQLDCSFAFGRVNSRDREKSRLVKFMKKDDRVSRNSFIANLRLKERMGEGKGE